MLLPGCDARPTQGSTTAAAAPASASADQVITSFYPTEYFASRIAGGLVNVSCPVPADADPIFWKPDDAAIKRYQSATLIVLNGADYEKWASTVSLPLTRVVDTAHAFDASFLRFQGVTHSHGAAGPHTHTGIDGHTWMDPNQAKLQAQAILAAMTRTWPQHEKAFGANYQSLAADLDTLDARLRAIAPALKAARLYASHPAYGYIARRYGLTIANVTLPPDEPATDAEWAEVAAAIAKEPADAKAPRVMLFESQPLPATVQGLKERHAMTSVVFSPCETLGSDERTKGEDYLKVMNENLDRLAAAVSAAGPN